MDLRSPFRRGAPKPAGEAVGPATGAGDARFGRRPALVRIAGLAVAGAVAERALRPAQADAATTGATAPAVAALTDAATISVDAAAGSDFRLTLGGDHTLGNPANPTDGQQIIFQVTQGTGGGYMLSYGTAYEFSSGLPQPALTTTAGHTDLLGFIYSAASGTWLLAAFVNGFS
jgi:hypothetical protein